MTIFPKYKMPTTISAGLIQQAYVYDKWWAKRLIEKYKDSSRYKKPKSNTLQPQILPAT